MRDQIILANETLKACKSWEFEGFVEV